MSYSTASMLPGYTRVHSVPVLSRYQYLLLQQLATLVASYMQQLACQLVATIAIVATSQIDRQINLLQQQLSPTNGHQPKCQIVIVERTTIAKSIPQLIDDGMTSYPSRLMIHHHHPSSIHRIHLVDIPYVVVLDISSIQISQVSSVRRTRTKFPRSVFIV